MSVLTQPKALVPAKFEAELTEIDAGMLKDVPVATSWTLNGKTLTQPQIDAQLKAYLATFEALDAAEQQYQAALAARRNITVEARDFYLQLKKLVVAYFGAQSPQLADFGITPAKARAPKTAAEKVVTAAKAELTRKARGTTSKKQKAQINPNEGTPMVSIGANGSKQVTPPTVINPTLPGKR